ncbi:MAG: secondary thiamine-phosphate synthase enzyme YjbQ [Muribaculaceae bacterium]
MIAQCEIRLPAMRRGCHLITGEILRHLPTPLPRAGLLNIFVKHTSCGLTINENADPDVRTDMSRILDHLVPENQPYYDHTMEGADDMPAHAKSSLTGVSLTIPITDGRLNLGTWQGIYLCEYRDYGGSRTLVATIYS